MGCLGSFTEKNPAIGSHALMPGGSVRTEGSESLIIYCEAIKNKSVSDPEHHVCACRTHLIKVNIHPQKCS